MKLFERKPTWLEELVGVVLGMVVAMECARKAREQAERNAKRAFEAGPGIDKGRT